MPHAPLARESPEGAGVSSTDVPAVDCSFHEGGDRFRLRSSIREKRAVVPGATLKSRDKKNKRELSVCAGCLISSPSVRPQSYGSGTGVIS